MPNIKSAKKRVKVIATKTLRNKALNSNLKTTIKKAEATTGPQRSPWPSRRSTRLPPRGSFTRTPRPAASPAWPASYTPPAKEGPPHLEQAKGPVPAPGPGPFPRPPPGAFSCYKR